VSAFFGFLAFILEAFVFVLIVYALLSWIPMSPDSPWQRLSRLLGAIVEPVLRPVRRLIPPIRTGGGAIDLSVLIVLIVVQVIVVPVLRAG
jgi:YggT family protein